MTAPEDSIELLRDCDAVQIPYGNTVTAREGTRVWVVQQLGDSYTVRTARGFLMRIGSENADALGKIVAKLDTQALLKGERASVDDEDALWGVLKTVYDPEIPANIVELGLIYTCKPEALAEGGIRVKVQMTLTAPGCGMGQVLMDDVERKLLGIPGVEAVNVALTFDPPWAPDMMSEAARLQLGMM